MTVLDFSKALLGDTSTMVFYAKRLLGGGETPFTKADFVDAIQARADATLPDKLTPQQRFSRAISGGDEVAMTRASTNALVFFARCAGPRSTIRNIGCVAPTIRRLRNSMKTSALTPPFSLIMKRM